MIDIQLLDRPLSPLTCTEYVYSPDTGGIVTFTGTVRNHTADRSVRHLEFESYEPMAIKEMRKIAETILRRWPARKVSFHHRLGTLGIGDLAVVIAVSCPHRREAFEACQYAIDTLKQTVPIWKKEVFEDGEVWVAAHP